MTLSADAVVEHLERLDQARYRTLRSAAGRYRSILAGVMSRSETQPLRDDGASRKSFVDAYIRSERKRLRAWRAEFIGSGAFGRVLEALPDGDASVATAGEIVTLLCNIRAHRHLMREHSPAEVFGLDTAKQKKWRAERLKDLEHLEEKLRAHTDDAQALNRGVETLRKVVTDVRPDIDNFWTGGLDASHYKRGTAAKWRGVIVRTLDARLPDVQDRPSTIAKLVQLSGDEKITLQNVVSFLLQAR